jgi:hypothetical protein
MTISKESKGSKLLSDLVRVSIPASVFTTGIVLTYGYVTGLIYSVGDPRQLTPIFAGIIFGTIVFSLVGFGLKRTRSNLLSLTILSIVFLVAAYGIIFLNSLAVNNTDILIVAFLITSPAMVVSQFIGNSNLRFSLLTRLILGSVQAILVIVLVFVFALEYELQGQVNLYLGPLIFLLVSAAYLVAIKLL